jgi:Na+-transporting methylmalonyl-CoA/oxaloacetate decarboxylase gamma subunit
VEFVIVLAILVIVVAVVGAPLRREWAEHAEARRRRPELDPARELAELEAARDAKYREIRDADLDHRTGKLSDED